MILKYPTSCCALAQMIANNNDSFEDLQTFVEESRKEAKLDWSGSFRQNGQRSLFCITSPKENKLENNLAQLGFLCLRTFQRRVGYGAGNLKFWWLDL